MACMPLTILAGLLVCLVFCVFYDLFNFLIFIYPAEETKGRARGQGVIVPDD